MNLIDKKWVQSKTQIGTLIKNNNNQNNAIESERQQLSVCVKTRGAILRLISVSFSSYSLPCVFVSVWVLVGFYTLHRSPHSLLSCTVDVWRATSPLTRTYVTLSLCLPLYHSVFINLFLPFVPYCIPFSVQLFVNGDLCNYLGI